MEIKNRTALVTGGASGLGAATVKRIIGAGGNVIILDVQEELPAAFPLPDVEDRVRGRGADPVD